MYISNTAAINNISAMSAVSNIATVSKYSCK